MQDRRGFQAWLVLKDHQDKEREMLFLGQKATREKKVIKESKVLQVISDQQDSSAQKVTREAMELPVPQEKMEILDRRASTELPVLRDHRDKELEMVFRDQKEIKAIQVLEVLREMQAD